MTDSPAKSFLLATFEGGGSVTPYIDVARRLRARGHAVRIMSDACNRREAEASGARFVPWTTAPSRAGRGREFDPIQDWTASTPFEAILANCNGQFTGPALAFAGDVMNELAREPADLVIASDMLFGVHLGCEALGQNMLVLAVNIHLFPPAGVPPMGPGLMPPRTPKEVTEQEVLRASLRAALDAGALPALNAARAALGLAPLLTLEDQHRAGRAQLLATARAFDFAPDPQPADLHYVGPILAEPEWAEPFASPFAASDQRPLVLTAFSTTFQNHAAAVQRTINAMARLPVRGLVTLGGSLVASDLVAAPHVALVPSAPHNVVMQDAAVVITHGGHGTVMKALAAGKPLLLMPHGRDQADNAARVAARGAGLVLPPDAGVSDIHAVLERLLCDGRYAAAAAELGRKVKAEAEGSRLIPLLEEFAEASPRPGALNAA